MGDHEWEQNEMEDDDYQNTCNDEEESINRTEDGNFSDVIHVTCKNLDQKLLRKNK